MLGDVTLSVAFCGAGFTVTLAVGVVAIPPDGWVTVTPAVAVTALPVVFEYEQVKVEPELETKEPPVPHA